MQLTEVNTNHQISLFHQLPYILYKEDKNWIAPLKQDIEKIFSSKQNKLFEHGAATRFLLLNDNNKIIGRVAAFINKNIATQNKLKVGGIGFFECINNVTAANKLFDACKNWLIERGCNTMDGPINFGERDRWWGLLADGFEPPLYGLNYHLPYYKKLFEQYGFKTYFEQYTFTLSRNIGMPKIVYQIRERLMQRNHVIFKPAEKNELDKYADDFKKIYNKAWQQHENFNEMSNEQSVQLLKEVKPIMDPSLFIFAYVKNEPAGFFIGLPDANQLLKYAHGNFNLWGKINVLLHKPFVKMKNIYGIIFGVIPEHQNKGIEAGMAATMHEMVNKNKDYEQIELLWIGDFNKKMLNFVEHIQAKKYRTLITYRKIFDETIPFERCPVIE